MQFLLSRGREGRATIMWVVNAGEYGLRNAKDRKRTNFRFCTDGAFIKYLHLGPLY